MEYFEICQNDYDTFHELANAYYREGEDAETPQEEIDSFIQFMFGKIINQEIYGSFAKVGSTYVGFVLWTIDTENFSFSEIPGFGTILEIGVILPYRSSGLGKELVAFVENKLCEKEVEYCYVSAYGPAQKFWLHCGYIENGSMASNGLPIMVKAIG